MITPQCRCCQTSNTCFYRHVFEGGFHIGLYCLQCRERALTGCIWYPRSRFTPDAIAAMPRLEQLETAPDPRQTSMFPPDDKEPRR